MVFNGRKIGASVGRHGMSVAVALAAVLAAGCSDNGTVDVSGDGQPASAASLSSGFIAEKSSWKKYVLDDADGLVYPAAVSVDGDSGKVSDADALEKADGRCATIRAGEKGKPKLTLDLGQNSGGRIELGLCGGDGTPIRLSYSEYRDYLDADGDYSGDNLSPDDDPEQRFNIIDSGRRPGDITLPGIQGAQRWIQLQLEGAGEVSLDYVRVKVDHYRPKISDYTSRFLSSDDQINRIWYGSAYTFNMASVRDADRGGNLVVMDGAKRDRLVWLGDLAIEGQVAYYSTQRAPGIIRDSITMFACQQFPNGYLPMASQIQLTCDENDPGPADGPLPNPERDPLLQVGRLGEYTAWWVIALAEYYRYSGDTEYAKTMLPVARRAMQYFENASPRGLYCTGSLTQDDVPVEAAQGGAIGKLVQRSVKLYTSNNPAAVCQPRGPIEINWHPFDIAYGEDGHTNAVVYRALRDLAMLERTAGDDSDAADAYDKQAAGVRQAMLDVLWDDAAGAFVGNSGNPKRNHTQGANVEAVYSDVVTGKRADRAMRFVDDKLYSRYGTLTGEFESDPFMSQIISPFISSDELLARFKRHHGGRAMSLLRSTWGHMIDSDPQSTIWEKLGKNGKPAVYNLRVGEDPDQMGPPEGDTSLAHPWGAGALPALSAYVLGVRALEPGYRRWLVEPQPVDLDWAQGQVDTPAGALAVRWRRPNAGNAFKLSVSGPEDMPGVVAVPLLGKDRVIAMDGRIVWRDGEPIEGVSAEAHADYVRFDGLTGKHTFAWAVDE